MTPLLLPDAELVIARALRADPDVAAMTSGRVYTEIPRDPVWPMLRLFRIGGTADTSAYYERARLQIDAWGESKHQARLLAATARHALLLMPGRVGDGAIIGEVVDDHGLLWAPDPDTGRPRYLFGVRILLHPAP